MPGAPSVRGRLDAGGAGAGGRCGGRIVRRADGIAGAAGSVERHAGLIHSAVRRPSFNRVQLQE